MEHNKREPIGFPNKALGFHIINELIVFVSRVAQVVTPEMLLEQVLGGLRDGSFSKRIKSIPMERLVNHVKDYYMKYIENPSDIQNLHFAKAFSNLIYLLDPDYRNETFDNVLNAVEHSWLDYIPKSIRAARPMRSIPGEVIERFAIPMANTTENGDEIIQLPSGHQISPPEEEEFNEDDLKKAKYDYKIAELCFVMHEYATTEQYLKEVLNTPYMNVDANGLLVQNSILWSEEQMKNNEFKIALDTLEKVTVSSQDPTTAELVADKIKEATVLHKITMLEEKCPLNERAVGEYIRIKIGYKKFLRLTYFIFGNVEFHQRMEEIRIFPKKMIYPLLKRDPTPQTEELIVKRHELHDKLIRELYEWFWNLDIVKHYLSLETREDLTNKFGEYGSGPVIYFRYISKGQYANIIISKAVELVSQGKVQEAKKTLFETFEFTGSKKIKGYLDFLRQHEKARKATIRKKVISKKKKKKTKRKK